MVAEEGKRAVGWMTWLKRIRKAFLWLLLSLVGLCLLTLLLLALPSSRSWLLQQGLNVASGSLPGQFSVAESAWPETGRLIFRNVLWVAAGPDAQEIDSPSDGDQNSEFTPRDSAEDTLAMLPLLELQLDWQAIRQGIIAVPYLEVQADVVNIPAIIANFEVAAADSSQVQVSDPAPPAAIPFFEPSAWPVMPAVVIDSLVVAVDQLVVEPKTVLSGIAARAFIDMGPGPSATLQVLHAETRLVVLPEPEPVLVLRDLGLLAIWVPEDDALELKSLSAFVAQAGAEPLAERWRNWGGIHLNLRGQGKGLLAGLPELDLAGDFNLPAPSQLADILPGQVIPLPEEPGHGEFTASTRPAGKGQPIGSAAVSLDLSATPWLDEAFLGGRMADGQAHIDTLALSLWGAELRAEGVVDSNQVKADFLVAMIEPTLVQMLVPAEMAVTEASFRLSGSADGMWPIPDLDLSLDGAFKSREYDLPSLRLHAFAHDDLGCGLELDVTEGLHTVPVVLDSLSVVWKGPHDFLMSPQAAPASLISQEPLGDYDQEFEAHVFSPEVSLHLAGVAVTDSLSRVRLDTLRVSAVNQTVAIADPVMLEFHVPSQHFRLENLAFSGEAGQAHATGTWSPQEFDIDAGMDLLLKEELLQMLVPSSMWSHDGGVDVGLEGSVDLTGSATGPVFGGGLKVALLPHRDRMDLVAATQFGLAAGDSEDLQATFEIQTLEEAILTGSVLWPGAINEQSKAWAPDSTQGLQLNVPSQSIDLARFNMLLPSDVSLEGDLDVALQLNDAAEQDSALAGQFQLEPLVVNLPNSSRVNLSMDCQASGTLGDPKVSGVIKVKSGFIRVPEIPANLLPTEGESLLLAAGIDSLFAPASLPVAINEAPVITDSGPGFLPDLDINIQMPGDLVVHGYGLSLELQGDLQVSRGLDPDGHPVPAINGLVEVHTGTLNFMNRQFTIDRGEVQFTGKAPSDPQLAVSMEAEVGEYLVRIEIRGVASDPQIEMIAEPELSQADVMALLLFGQPATDLDTSERGRMSEEVPPGQQLQQNLAALAVVFGTSGMQNRVSGTLGVDMVELGSGSDGDSTLMVGKFITPRILVKYNQSLEKSGTYFMTLEYSITKFLDFVSTYGQGEEDSGLELKWSRRD